VFFLFSLFPQYSPDQGGGDLRPPGPGRAFFRPSRPRLFNRNPETFPRPIFPIFPFFFSLQSTGQSHRAPVKDSPYRTFSFPAFPPFPERSHHRDHRRRNTVRTLLLASPWALPVDIMSFPLAQAPFPDFFFDHLFLAMYAALKTKTRPSIGRSPRS